MLFHATLARSFIQSLRVQGDDDFVDRLNYYYTPIMLAIACVVISAKQYGGTPIECWVNPHSREGMEEYIESYCWIQNTYWVPMYENIPDDHTSRENRQIGYYQWVPFILIAEALMFSFPCIIWRLLNWQSGINLQTLINSACDTQSIVDHFDRSRAIRSISQSLLDILDLQACERKMRVQPELIGWRTRFSLCRRYHGCYVTALYLIIKLFYTLNIVLQFMMLNAALKSHDYALYGFQVLSDLLRGRPWTESGHFPRVTLCDFQVRYLANLNSYTVQCALLINFINEKVFAFFWCWYLLMVVITSCSCMFWIINSWLSSQRAAFVLKFIHIAASSDTQQELKITTRRPGQRIATLFTAPPHLMEKFVEKFLNNDGVFTLRLMANHAGDIIVMQVVKYLWLEFRERHWREFDIDFSHNGPFSSNNAKKVDTLGGEEKPLATRVILRQSVSDDSDRRNRTSSVPPKTRQAHSYPPLADSDSPLL